LHVARSTVRQAERRVVTVAQVQEVAPVAVRYLNRLSDYLFTAARWVNFQEGAAQIEWHAGKIQ
jgi:cob(I)alamin adenosyltransferase